MPGDNGGTAADSTVLLQAHHRLCTARQEFAAHGCVQAPQLTNTAARVAQQVQGTSSRSCGAAGSGKIPQGSSSTLVVSMGIVS